MADSRNDAMRDLADKLAITELVHAYCRSVDRLDVRLGHSVFHKDSYADYGAGYYQGPGRGVIDRICEDHLKASGHHHQVGNVLIELDGDDAGSETYVTASVWTERDGTPLRITAWGRYCDRWQRRRGRWGILHRVYVCDRQEAGEVRNLPSHARAARRDRDDPSYPVMRGKS